MVSADAAMAVLDLRQPEELLELVERGHILYAFNVACQGSRRSELRLLARSVEDYLALRAGHKAPPIESWEAVLRLIFRDPGRPQRWDTIYRRWCVSQAHVRNLCKSGELRLVRGSLPHRGPTGSPLVEWASLVDFLERRRVC